MSPTTIRSNPTIFRVLKENMSVLGSNLGGDLGFSK
jgi:hypothetical protein